MTITPYKTRDATIQPIRGRFTQISKLTGQMAPSLSETIRPFYKTQQAKWIKKEPSALHEAKYDEDDNEDEEDSMDDDASLSDDTEETEEVPKWNSFKDAPVESDSISMADNSIIDASIQTLKLLAYLITFGMVLLGAILSKTVLLLMTSQLAPDRMITVPTRNNMFLGLTIPQVEKYLWIWALFISFSVPELGVLIRSLRIALFKGHEKDDEHFDNDLDRKREIVSFKYIFIVTTVMETLHVIGLSVFVFEVLPRLDVAKGIMLTNCVCIVPGFLNVISHSKKYVLNKFKTVVNILALLFQITGLIGWPALRGTSDIRVCFVPISLLLMSCGWWMNYVSEESSNGFINFLARIKDRLKEQNIILYRLYIGMSLWKILVFFGTTLLVLTLQGTDIVDFFQKTQTSFQDRVIIANEVEMLTRSLTDKIQPVSSIGSGIWWVIGAQVASAYICYIFSKFACRVMIQAFSFAFPCALVVPLTVILIVIVTGLRNQDPFLLTKILPPYVFFNSPHIYNAKEFFLDEHTWIWIFWTISQVWITFHIWHPRCERLSKTETLFATPMYSAFLVDQSVALNRRRDEVDLTNKEKTRHPHVIACATMWHETKPEMLEMLKSLLRIDNDQCLKRVFKKNDTDPEAEANYYTFESHIFFDDAFELENEESTRTVINRFVRCFIRIMIKATKDIYGTDEWIKPPLKYSTPYGGRLEYTLPGENKLYVHLKDKDKIRHKKRWSQVMYMYYLLGYKLMEQPIPNDQKLEIAENTFLLALDGDIDFKPDAVLLLVDLMKKNKDLGAACGRIHPVGSGFMVWYQLFEYAIGHWLQKATEHMIGCVLCSPGCFSLFRAKALMSPNVMKRYTTKAEEARQYVQYDQGEDRWLCTLLLKRGYRVEYSAASDAYTHCPETFNEFYTQRRRWVPSTMANIIDLLNDYKHTVRINNDISLPYIVYQMIMLMGTILGPGTILLMLVGAFNTAFKIDNWTALYYNLIPIVSFILCCLFTSGKFQLSAALIISLMYGLIMMAVLVGIVMEIKDDGFLSPSSLFLFITAGEIIISGIFHPQELYCLFCGVIYYVTIPSMYLLLIIYSVCNLNVVSWGTREVAKKKTKADLENEKKEAEIAEKKAQKTKLFGILDSFSSNQEKEANGVLEFSLSNIFKCMCCTSEKPNPVTDQFVKIGETLNVLKKKMEDIERGIDGTETTQLRSTVRMSTITRDKGFPNIENPIEELRQSNLLVEAQDDEDDEDMRDDLFNPYWIEDKELKKSKFEVLSSEEITFWKELIKKYLYPLIDDKEKQKEVKKNLKELRDKMVVTFFMLNALFVVVVFLLQVNKDQIHIKWPLGAKSNITFNTVTYEITIKKTYLQLEPVGLTFISFFASVLVIQFSAMLFHRFETLCHLLSNTPLTILQRKKALSYKEKLEYAKKQFNRQNQNMRKESGYEEGFPIENLAEKQKSRIMHPDEMIDIIIKQMKEDEERVTAEKAERRRSSLLPWRRLSFQDKASQRRTPPSGLGKIEED